MATAPIKLRPFTVPNFVICEMPARPKQDGMVNPPKFALHELDDETLLSLCDEFKLAVMAKARADRSPATTHEGTTP